MSLVARGGSLLSVGGTLTTNQDCCCEDGTPCSCTILTGVPTPLCCDCLEVDFGAHSTWPALGVTVAGDTTYQGFISFDCPTGINRLFMVNCGDVQIWWYHQQIGTTFIGGVFHYQYVSLRVTINFCNTGDPVWGPGQLEIEIRSVLFNSTSAFIQDEWIQSGPPNAFSYESDSFDSWIRRSYAFSFSQTRNYDWQFVLGGSCREECNSLVTWPYCQSPLTFSITEFVPRPTNFYTNPGSPSGGRCRVTDLTLTPYSPNG